jgi:hypothetical protein
MPLAHVSLLYSTKPEIVGAVLLTVLQKRCGRVELMTSEGAFFTFVFPDHLIQYAEGKTIPAQCMINVIDSTGDAAELENALQQSWDWRDEARKVLETCHAAILINEFMAEGLPRAERFTLFRNIVAGVIDLVSPAAIHWSPSDQIIRTADLLHHAAGGDPLFPVFNVRMFNVQDGRAYEKVMDTVGLTYFGVPDLQCHFVGLPANEVARILMSYAYYLFEHGDVINDGESIQGITPAQKWYCRHEIALIGPERVVLDVNPGGAYSTGIRETTGTS